MNKTRKWIMIGFCALALMACGDKNDPVQASSGADLPSEGEGVYYCSTIKDIFSNHCTKCHAEDKTGADRFGAPINVNLDTYDSAVDNASRADARVQDGSMPPGGGVALDERQALTDWIDAGAPEGECSSSDE